MPQQFRNVPTHHLFGIRRNLGAGLDEENSSHSVHADRTSVLAWPPRKIEEGGLGSLWGTGQKKCHSNLLTNNPY